MTPGRTAVLAAGCLVAALWALWRAGRRPRPTIRTIRGRLGLDQNLATAKPTASPIGAFVNGIATGRLGAEIDARLGSSIRIAETTLIEVVGRVVAAFALGLLVTLLTLTSLGIAGVLAPAWWWPVVAIAVAVIMAAQMFGDVRSRADRRRQDLRRVTNDFVQLVAVGLTTNRSVEEAVLFAAQTGDGDGFARLRHAVETAPQRGIAVWDALHSFATAYELDELADLSGSLAQQAGVGVSVAATVRAEAKALREKQLASLAAAADEADANLALPTMGMVIGMMLFIAYPVMQQVSEAFTR